MLVQFMTKMGCVRDVPKQVATLTPRVVSGPPTHITFDYVGHDTACTNIAVMRWHLGDIEGSRELLVQLAQNHAALSPKEKLRVAVMLHLTRHAASPAQESEKLIATLLPDLSAPSDDPVLAKMVQVAFGDTRSWYSVTTKHDHHDKIMYYNNAGIEAYSEAKPAVASALFSKAMQLVAQFHTGGTQATCPWVASAVAFNVGLCAIARGDGAAASAALTAAAHTMNDSALYWVRVAQALVLRLNALNIAFASTSPVATASSRSGTALKCLPRGLLAQSSAARQLCLEVKQAAGNALLLLCKGETVVATASRLQHTSSFRALLAALTFLSWAELQFGNYPAVAKHTLDYFTLFKQAGSGAASLLSSNYTSPVMVSFSAAARNQTTAAMLTYAVEALCALSRSAQAVKLLASLELGDVIADTAHTGQAEALFISLCVAHVMNGAWVKAVAVAQHVIAKYTSPFAQLLLVYIELAQGNRDKAMDLLERMPVVIPRAAAA